MDAQTTPVSGYFQDQVLMPCLTGMYLFRFHLWLEYQLVSSFDCHIILKIESDFSENAVLKGEPNEASDWWLRPVYITFMLMSKYVSLMRYPRSPILLNTLIANSGFLTCTMQAQLSPNCIEAALRRNANPGANLCTVHSRDETAPASWRNPCRIAPQPCGIPDPLVTWSSLNPPKIACTCLEPLHKCTLQIHR